MCDVCHGAVDLTHDTVCLKCRLLFLSPHEREMVEAHRLNGYRVLGHIGVVLARRCKHLFYIKDEE